MEMKADSDDVVMRFMLDLGEALLSCGAEVWRVEDTISRIGASRGVARMNVLVFTTSIVVTMDLDDRRSLTHSRRIMRPNSQDFTKLDALNALSRDICSEKIGIDAARGRLGAICGSTADSRVILAGNVLGVVGFTLLFGGNMLDCIAAGACGAAAYFISSFVGRYAPNHIMNTLACSFFVGAIICVLDLVFPILHHEKVMIGVIMLLVPGAAFTASVRDLLTGDTVYGTMRLVESMLWAGALACGMIFAMAITGTA